MHDLRVKALDVETEEGARIVNEIAPVGINTSRSLKAC